MRFGSAVEAVVYRNCQIKAANGGDREPVSKAE